MCGKNDNNDVGAADYRSLMAAIRDHLGERRYLVVLYDIWDAHLWEQLHRMLADGSAGSRVVITTRSGDVAKAAEPGRTMELEPLPHRDTWMLGQTCPGHLPEITTTMLDR